MVTPMIALSGYWRGEGMMGSKKAFITVEYDESSSITVDMSEFGRPDANGSIIDSSTITVTFPDDGTYTGKLEKHPTRINWSNGTVWKPVIIEG
jgi:hypothetical protein